jgi:hypothetical protein
MWFWCRIECELGYGRCAGFPLRCEPAFPPRNAAIFVLIGMNAIKRPKLRGCGIAPHQA